MSGENLANAIPTASGLFDSGGRKANIDLAVKHNEFISFIELKWDSNSPLYAAFELVGYAMAWLQARLHATEMGYISKAMLRPALDTDHCQWVVLAPPDYYHATDEQFLKTRRELVFARAKGLLQVFFPSMSVQDSNSYLFQNHVPTFESKLAFLKAFWMRGRKTLPKELSFRRVRG